MLGKHCLHLDHLSLSSTKLDMQSTTELEMDDVVQPRRNLSSSCFFSLSHLFLKSNTFRSPKVSICLLLPLLLLLLHQVLSQLLVCTKSLTNLTIFHKLTTIHQNRTPAQVSQFQFNFVETKCAIVLIQESLTDESLARVLRMNPLTKLSNLLLSTTDHQMGPLLLTEKSLYLVAATCPRLERLGNLQR